jgi:hypothetical protein
MQNWKCLPNTYDIVNTGTVVKQLIDDLDIGLVIGPAGIGGHVDHLICKSIAVELGEKRKVPCYLYEDIPYVLDCKKLFRADVAIAIDQHIWNAANAHYPSQSRTWRPDEVLRRCQSLGERFGMPVLRLFSDTKRTFHV